MPFQYWTNIFLSELIFNRFSKNWFEFIPLGVTKQAMPLLAAFFVSGTE
jgi:hypothetical protein